MRLYLEKEQEQEILRYTSTAIIIIIGDDCRFIKDGSLWIENNECELIIGKFTSFISAHLAVTESKSKIIIGEDCMFAYDIDVRTGDSHSILDMQSGRRINYAADVKIGNHVWVAAHSIILKGVQIMDNCIIGTGSVVTKSCGDSNVIYAGNPAKVVKTNISWSRERI
jgi:acetyltransferase-like isoleucine patch superfamily enzyme